MKWKAKFTGEIDGVINGVSPTIGPTQTIPLDMEAFIEAGLLTDPKEDKEKAKKDLTRLKDMKQAGRLPDEADFKDIEKAVK